MLEGYRTYIMAAAMTLTTLAYAFGYINKEQWEIIMGFLVGTGAATLRLGMTQDSAKVEAKIMKEVNTVQADIADVKVEVKRAQ